MVWTTEEIEAHENENPRPNCHECGRRYNAWEGMEVADELYGTVEVCERCGRADIAEQAELERAGQLRLAVG